MVKDANGLWNIWLFGDTVFTSLETDEAFSALLMLADYYDGGARFEGELIWSSQGRW